MTEKSPAYNLLNGRPTFKPFQYSWAYDAWLLQQQVHWLPEEIALADDVKDWHRTLTEAERHLVTQIFRMFTQQDTEVENAYIDLYMPRFKPTEIRMMLTAFTNMESIHQVAYSHLLDTIGMPETEYSAFLEYEEMAAKHEFLKSFKMTDHYNTALAMAVFAGFTEGLQLFASFAMLLNLPRRNLMKGMGQVVTWSVRDETLHVNSISKLFHTYLQEFGQHIDKKALHADMHKACRQVVENEDRFIDLAFEMGPVEGMSSDDVKAYIRFIADRRLAQLGLAPIYNQGSNPLPWIDDMLNAVEHANFFENRSTEYTRAATTGVWDDDAFSAPGEPVIFTIPEGCPFCERVKRVWDDLERPVRVIEVSDPLERQRLYDQWGLEGYDRTMPKAFREDGTLLKTSTQIEDWLEANYAH